MDRLEAEKIVRQIRDIPSPTEEEIFLYTDALSFLIEKTGDTGYMMELGGYYYEIKNYDLALKYYEMAADKDNTSAYTCLGYIWYYGRTGQKDYDKAFMYYSKAMKRGDLVSAYKVADMYKNGYSVEKNYEEYKRIIRRLYTVIERNGFRRGPVSDILTRYARMMMEEGKNDEAIKAFRIARRNLTDSLEWNAFWGDLNVMKWLIGDLYKLIEPNPDDLDIYDLYYLLTKPWKGVLIYDGETEVESLMEDGECVIRFGDKWFRNTDDFFKKATVTGERITAHARDIEVRQKE